MAHRYDKTYFNKRLKNFTTSKPDHSMQELSDFASDMGYYLQVNFLPLAMPAEVVPFLKKDQDNDNDTNKDG